MCTPRRKRIEVLIETFLRKQLGLKAHTVTKVEETEKFMVVDAGAVEHADRTGLLPQRSLSVVLGLPAAQACWRSPGEMDALGHAFSAGAIQEIRAHMRPVYIELGIVPSEEIERVEEQAGN